MQKDIFTPIFPFMEEKKDIMSDISEPTTNANTITHEDFIKMFTRTKSWNY